AVIQHRRIRCRDQIVEPLRGRETGVAAAGDRALVVSHTERANDRLRQAVQVVLPANTLTPPTAGEAAIHDLDIRVNVVDRFVSRLEHPQVLIIRPAPEPYTGDVGIHLVLDADVV